MSTASARLAIDGKWVECQPTDEYGALGVRYTCDLRDEDGRPAKRLLLRRRALPAPGDSAAQLVASKTFELGKGLRPAVGKTYQEVQDQGQQPCKVLQQDVTGLTPLGRAVLQALKDGDTARVWRLFYAACQALRQFGNSAGAGQLVALQSPPSLAVTREGSVVLLDAEIRVAGSLAQDSPVKRLFGAWFGAAGASGFAAARPASLLHSRAMLAYFLNLLRQSAQAPTPTARAATVKVATKLQQAPADAGLDDLESWVRNNSEDWNLSIDEESPAPAETEAPRPEQRVRQGPPAAAVPLINVEPVGPLPNPPRRKRSLFLRASLILNVLLIAALVILWLLWPKGAAGKPFAIGPWAADGDAPASDAPVTFSSYCVIVPTQGTISENVAGPLADLFPGNKPLEIRGDPAERKRLLLKERDESVKALEQPEKLKQLLVDLTTNHSVRFTGFDAAAPNDTLPVLVEAAGVFTISGPSGNQYGSLLQPNSVDKLLTAAGMGGKEEPRALLNGLVKAVQEYASLQDALSIINDRTAYLLKVQPTPAAHEAARKQLLSRQDKPVFISRPVPELFDAVDPSAGGGGGSARSTN